MQPLLIEIPRILGVRADDCLLALAIGIPFFFLWRWVFRKFIKSKALLIVTSCVTAFVTTPSLFAALILLGLNLMTYYPQDKFDRDRWLVDKEKRYELATDIIKSQVLIGKTKIEVEQLLGKEHNEQSNSWEYYLGFVPGIGNTDPDVLSIEFENGRVSAVGQHET